MLRRRFLLLTALAFTSPVLAASETPVEIVTRIYKMSAGPKNDYAGESAFFDNDFRQQHFSRSLLAAVLAMDKKTKSTGDLILDFDPITDSQDPSVKGLKISPGTIGSDKAYAIASFYYTTPKDATLLRYFFVLENGAWKLDNIANPSKSRTWSLRQLIK